MIILEEKIVSKNKSFWKKGPRWVGADYCGKGDDDPRQCQYAFSGVGKRLDGE